MKIVSAGDYLSRNLGNRRPTTFQGYPYNAEDEIRPYSRWSYVKLSCGHLTTPEEIEAYHVWQPKRGRYWCENCAKWLPKMQKEKVTYPQEAMF